MIAAPSASARPGAKAASATGAPLLVLDGIVNGVGTTAKVVGAFVYKWIDQGAIDGTVNGSGLGAEGLGGSLRRIQTGRVQQYGSLLFGATALLAIGLVIFV